MNKLRILVIAGIVLTLTSIHHTPSHAIQYRHMARTFLNNTRFFNLKTVPRLQALTSLNNTSNGGHSHHNSSYSFAHYPLAIGVWAGAAVYHDSKKPPEPQDSDEFNQYEKEVEELYATSTTIKDRIKDINYRLESLSNWAVEINQSLTPTLENSDFKEAFIELFRNNLLLVNDLRNLDNKLYTILTSGQFDNADRECLSTIAYMMQLIIDQNKDTELLHIKIKRCNDAVSKLTKVKSDCKVYIKEIALIIKKMNSISSSTHKRF